MSLTYVSNKNPDSGYLGSNSSGDHLLGLIHEATGAKVDKQLKGPLPRVTKRLQEEYDKAMQLRAEGKYHESSVHWQPHIPDKISPEEVAEVVATIRGNKDKIKFVFDTWCFTDDGKQILFDGPYEEFLEWIEEWCCWLEENEGYCLAEAMMP